MTRQTLRTVVLVGLVGGFFQPTNAETITWTGFGDGTSWDNDLNWDLLRLPEPADDVVIPDVANTSVVVYSALALNTTVSSIACDEPFHVTGGALTVNGTSDFGSGFSLSGGQFGGNGTQTIAGLFDWTGGTLTGSGSTVVTDDVYLSGGSKTLTVRTLTNNGAGTWTGGPLQLGAGATWNNSAGATLDVMTADDFLWNQGGAAPHLNNAGAITVSSAGGTVEIGATTANTGSIIVQSGTLRFNGQFSQTSGATRVALGAVLIGQSVLDFSGGTVSGAGILQANVSNGGADFQPGLSPGTLFVSLAYRSTMNAKLTIELGGTGAGQFDFLNCGGLGAVLGTLTVVLANGFQPHVGEEFQFFAGHPRSGTFSTVVLPPGLTADVVYLSDAIKLVVTGVPSCVSCDVNCDGSVNLFDIDPFVAAILTQTGCSPCAGDTNGDGTTNLFDIQAFVECLTP